MWEERMFWRDYACLERCWSCCENVRIWQCGLQQRKMKAKTDTYSGQGQGFFICHIINYTGYNQKWNVKKWNVRSDESFDLRHFLSAARGLVRCSWRTSDNQGIEGAEMRNGYVREERRILQRKAGREKGRVGFIVGGTRVAKCNVNVIKKWSEICSGCTRMLSAVQLRVYNKLVDKLVDWFVRASSGKAFEIK